MSELNPSWSKSGSLCRAGTLGVASILNPFWACPLQQLLSKRATFSQATPSLLAVARSRSSSTHPPRFVSSGRLLCGVTASCVPVMDWPSLHTYLNRCSHLQGCLKVLQLWRCVIASHWFLLEWLLAWLDSVPIVIATALCGRFWCKLTECLHTFHTMVVAIL